VRCRVVRLIDPDGFRQGVRLRQAAFEAFRMGEKRGLQGLSTRLEDSVGQAVVHRLGGEQRNARVVMRGVIPVEKALAMLA
jgi:hypothetical protein